MIGRISDILPVVAVIMFNLLWLVHIVQWYTGVSSSADSVVLNGPHCELCYIGIYTISYQGKPGLDMKCYSNEYRAS